ncbi:hypothetical protein P5673_005140 [Acropora cervicornis]|uniref:Uncharacterized protein n=1 Tax=Acropora cervicornis TaxID=6130 RepID=A0AAD9VDT6_ACRCE|nr:hypothetical protein P5673_005140 [Acropora cervicornis]
MHPIRSDMRSIVSWWNVDLSANAIWLRSSTKQYTSKKRDKEFQCILLTIEPSKLIRGPLSCSNSYGDFRRSS